MHIFIYSVAIMVCLGMCFKVESDKKLVKFDKLFCLYFSILCGGYFSRLLFIELF